MNTAFQDTLLQLFQQVTDNPDSMPNIPVNGWQEGSQEWQLLTSFHDMLERTQQRLQDALKAEEQLREKEAQYRSIFEAAIDALFIANLDGFIVEANPAACRTYGYTYEEFIGLHGTAITAPDSRHLVAEALQAIRAGDKYQVPVRAAGLRKDGSTFMTDGYSTPFMYKGQLHILAVVRDISERMQAEQELREKEAQYRGIFEATIDALCILTLDGFIVEANPAACSMYGYSYEELLSMKGADIVSPTSLPVVLEAMQTITTGGKLQTMIRADCVHKDGTTYLTEGHATLLMYKGKTHILTVARDVTEQVRAEEQLREKEAEYRSIFEASTDGLVINDPEEGHFVEVNPAMYRMHGYSYEEFMNLQPTTVIHPEYHHLFREYIQTVNAGREFQARAVDVRKDGTLFPVEVHGTTFTYKGKPHVLAVIRDVTEQVHAEEQLREKEAQYRSIFEASTDALIINDLVDQEVGRVVEVNPAACKMYGYSYEEFIGLPLSAIVPPDRLSFVMKKALPTIRAGREYHVRGVFNLRKDGTPFPIDLHETAFNYQGKLHMLSVVRDITEQVRAEQELREKEAEYRSVFEAGTDGLVINDLEDGHLVEVNPAMYKMHGYTYEEFMALHPMSFIHPDSHALFAEYLYTVKAGHLFHARATDVRKDGAPFPVEVHGTTFTYKGKPHVLAVVRDVTEQVLAEEQLREKEAQYRSIFEATTDGLVICDLEGGHLVEANPAACKIYGYSYEEFIGLPPSAIIHPEKLPAFMEKGLPAVRAGGERHTQGVNLRKDGSAFPVDLHQTAFIYQGKRHMLGVVRDITEQVQAQQLLEQRVEERTRELSTLLEVSHNVASTIELKPLLGLILDQLQEVVHYGGAAIATVQDDDFIFLDYLGPLAQKRVAQMRLLFSQSAAHQQVLHSGEPVIIADVLEDSFLAQSLREASREHLGKEAADYMHSWMGIPLKSKERVIGLLSLSHNEPNYFTSQHASMAMAIANQAAVAIENARLYEQAQAFAALEERQRLARELHDSVSQALYGISLGAHTARTLLERDPSKVAEPLSYVLTQAETALTEMRALIFELRPESLEMEGLVAALGRQASALHARHAIEVSMELGDEPDLPLKVKQELYRFAQEALHNTVKHARASRVDMLMHSSAEGFLLEIGDDGVGFDPESAFPGHLGLHSMRERVARLGGVLQIESAPGEGTRIHLRLPASTTLFF